VHPVGNRLRDIAWEREDAIERRRALLDQDDAAPVATYTPPTYQANTIDAPAAPEPNPPLPTLSYQSTAPQTWGETPYAAIGRPGYARPTDQLCKPDDSARRPLITVEKCLGRRGW
jgi:hypothetical protein